MKKSGSRWILTLLRYGLCVAAIAFLAYTVKWHDRVHLKDGTQVRLIAEGPEGYLIQQNGERRTVGRDEIVTVEVAGETVPDIEYGIAGVVERLDWGQTLIAVVIFAPVWFIQAYRLVVMVAVQGVRLGYWNAVKLTFAGNFFNFALPGTTGGDVVKAYYLSHYTHRKTEVVTTVFLDRAIGLLSVVMLAAGGIAMRWDPTQFGHLVGVLVVVFAALLVGIVVVFSRRVRHALQLSTLAERLPMGEQILRVGRATVALRTHKGHAVASVVLSLVLQSIVIVSAAIMARALGMAGDFSYYFIYVAIGFLIAAIPIAPPQAIGVMEAAYVQFFTRAGLASASQAVALALAVRLIQLVWALPGVLVPLLGAHRPSKAELTALEQEAAANTPASPAGLSPASQE